MVEAVVVLKNGNVFTVQADTLVQLFADLEPMAKDVVQINGKVKTRRDKE